MVTKTSMIAGACVVCSMCATVLGIWEAQGAQEGHDCKRRRFGNVLMVMRGYCSSVRVCDTRRIEVRWKTRT